MNLSDLHTGMPISIKWEMLSYIHVVHGQSGIIDKITPREEAPVSIIFQDGSTFSAALEFIIPYER
jgi:hypothetical protein